MPGAPVTHAGSPSACGGHRGRGGGAVVLALAGCASSGDGEAAAGAVTPSAGPTSHEYRPGPDGVPPRPRGRDHRAGRRHGARWLLGDRRPHRAGTAGRRPRRARSARRARRRARGGRRRRLPHAGRGRPVRPGRRGRDRQGRGHRARSARRARPLLGRAPRGARRPRRRRGCPRTARTPWSPPTPSSGWPGPTTSASSRMPRRRSSTRTPTPSVWADANPVLLAARRPELPVLLLHGADDDVVAPEFSTDFAAALRERGPPDDAEHRARRGPRQHLHRAGGGRPGRLVAGRPALRFVDPGPLPRADDDVVLAGRLLDLALGGGDELVGEPPQGPGHGELVTDVRDAGVRGAAAAGPLGRERLGRVGEERDGRGRVVATSRRC